MRRDEEAPTPIARTRRHRTPALLALLLIAVILASGASRTVAEPLDTEAPADRFSAGRAMEATEQLLSAPRVVGTPAHDEAHADLTAALEQLGFTVDSHDAVGTHRIGDRAFAGHTRSLIATRPGADPTGTIVLATHYDSVVSAPGSTDAGIGIAVILETVRALGPDAQRNDLVVLLVDAEEWGLLGAAAVIRDRADEFREPVVVLNHEARGLSGRPLVTRTAGPAAALIEGMPAPETESLFDAMFAFIPNYTDFSVYRDDGDWWGLDMAVVGDPYAYHSPQDDLAHRDAAALQHYGELTLGVTRDLGARDLAALETSAPEPGSTVLLTLPWGVQQIDVNLLRALAVVGVISLGGLVLTGRRARELTLRGALLGALAGLLALLGAVIAGAGLWTVVRTSITPSLSASLGEPFHVPWHVAAEVAVALAAIALILLLARIVLSARALVLGAALALMVLLTVGALLQPALSAWLVLPVSIAAAGAAFASQLPGGAAMVVRAVALLPTGWMLGRMLLILTDFGIASAHGIIAATIAVAVLGILPVLLLAPIEPPSRQDGSAVRPSARPRPRALPSLALLLVPAIAAGAFTGVGITVNRSSAEPLQHSVDVTVAGGTAQWAVTPSTDWGRALDGTAAPADITGPDVEMERLAEDRVRLRITSTRGAQRLRLETTADAPGAVPDATGRTLRDLTVDGVEVPGEDGATSLTVVGLEPGATCNVEVTVTPGSTLVIQDLSDDPSEIPGWTDPPEHVSIVQPVIRAGTEIDV